MKGEGASAFRVKCLGFGNPRRALWGRSRGLPNPSGEMPGIWQSQASFVASFFGNIFDLLNVNVNLNYFY